jgi:predicted naringenin-chalcone synthase
VESLGLRLPCDVDGEEVTVNGAYLNRLAVAVPENEVHGTFVQFAERALRDRRARLVFGRMASRSEIERRWSCLRPATPGSNERVDADGFYTLGGFPGTAARMQRYEQEAPVLAARAVDGLDLGDAASEVTHLVVASCTGMSAPGVDFEVIRRCNLNLSVERNHLGFMGCNAAINALKLARHIVRSEADAKVLVVCVELCTLHLQESEDLERLLTFLLFADGCAAALVSADPTGFALDGFHAEVMPEAAGHITWSIGDAGFDMLLSGEVPPTIGAVLRSGSERVLSGASPADIALWAVHPGGRTVLDAVESAFELQPEALAYSRGVLRDYGNMSSPTVLFVLEAMMRQKPAAGARGCAMAFGPGLTAETMLFSAV